MDAFVSGGDKDAVAVYVEILGKAIAGEELIGQAKVATEGFSGDEEGIKRGKKLALSVGYQKSFSGDEEGIKSLSGSIIESKKQGILFVSEPVMEGTIEKDDLSFSGSSFSSFSAFEAAFWGFEETGLFKPGADGFSGDGKAVFIFKHVSEVGDIEIGVTGLEEEDFLSDFIWVGVRGFATAVSVDESFRAGDFHFGFKAFEVSGGDIEDFSSFFTGN